MADATLTLPIALRGGGPPVVNSLLFGTNTWQHIEMRINSTTWNLTDGLFLGYSARVSMDGGITFTDWGGFTATSPTFMKDGVTKIEPGGRWDWNSDFANGGTFEITVDCPVAFLWGATVNLLDL